MRDVEGALRDYDVQVAIVSPEAERHCDLSIRAALAGKHVVQDKPLATRRADADRLVEAVERSGVKFLMWNRNTFPAVLHAREQIAAGAIGRPRMIHVDFYFAKDAGPPRGSRPPGSPSLDWRAHQLAAHVDNSDGGLGQGPLGELSIEGIYPLAYIRWLTGADVRRVFARAAAHFHQVNVDNGVEDLATVTLELDGGLIGSLAIGRIGAASHPSGGEIKLHVLGSDGALVVNEAQAGGRRLLPRPAGARGPPAPCRERLRAPARGQLRPRDRRRRRDHPGRSAPAGGSSPRSTRRWSPAGAVSRWR